MMQAHALAAQSLSHAFATAFRASGRDQEADAEAQLAKLRDLQRRLADEVEALWSSAGQADAKDPPGPSGAPDEAPGPDAQVQELIARSYALGSTFLQDLIATADVDERSRRQLQLLTRQYIDAVNPANFLPTNPEALARAAETNGESLRAGLANLLGDMARGQVSLTDPDAFTVGRDLASTPGAVVFENELIQLIQYTPTSDLVDEYPLLIVPPCINRFYILDLQAENSFVRHALDQGQAVFMLSWRSATGDIAGLTWDDYLRSGVLTALDVARRITGSAKAHGLGFCIGGTLLSCAAAIARTRGEDPLASLTLLTTMLDFAETGEIGLLIDAPLVAAREATIGRGGLLLASELASVFSMLRANDLVWPYVISNYLKGEKPKAFDILHWNADGTNLPGPMVCWYLRNAYLENRLCLPGETVQCGVPVDLSRVDMPVYVLAAREDHIVPWTTAFAATHLLSGKVRFVLGASGHIAGVINPPARERRSYWTGGQLGIGPLTWLRTAEEVRGSWWMDWADWLRRQSGRRTAAPTRLGSAAFPVIEPAPGRYVMCKAEPACP